MSTSQLELTQRHGYWCGRFQAMASPCEVLLDGGSRAQALQLATLVHTEALRIEHKFSRYRHDNIIHRINHAEGLPVEVDEETALLLNYAQSCYELSEGRFDITSGVLRQAWHFDGSARIPEQTQIDDLLRHVGFDKLRWQSPNLSLQAGMEIDLGGIGKEYAVDRAALLLQQQGVKHALVNFGGDLHVLGPRSSGLPWQVAIEDPRQETPSLATLAISQGAMATSGDSHRYLLHKGIRYAHILDPRKGWPVPEAPCSVTVVAPTCLQAGMLATFAMLEGRNAEPFLADEGVEHWISR